MKTIQAALIFCAMLLALAEPAKAQSGCPWELTTNSDGTLNIAYYDGTDLSVNIPATICGIPVTSISSDAFDGTLDLYYVSIPSSLTNIAPQVFGVSLSLIDIAVDPGNPVYSTYYSEGFGALCNKSQTTFIQCPGDIYLPYTVPTSVTSIAGSAFFNCTGLPSVLIPAGVTNIGGYCFGSCYSLTSVYFQGNAPATDSTMFEDDDQVTVYYLPGTTGWSDFSANAEVPVVLWNPLIETADGYFGVQSNMFGFNITGTNNFTVVVEACTDLANPVWVPLTTNTLVNGSFYFSDPQWTNYPTRFYGLSMP